MAEVLGREELRYLEKVNAIVDLCIDRELYEYLDDIILFLSQDAKIFIDKLQDKEIIDTLQDKNKGQKAAFFSNMLFDKEIGEIPPITKVHIPPNLIKDEEDLNKQKPMLLHNGDHPLLKRWSQLFWAKRIRAELLRQNKNPWQEWFDELLFYLETHMPSIGDRAQEENNGANARELIWKATVFNFLMELSAVAVCEASYGYAERARGLLKDDSLLQFDETTPEKLAKIGTFRSRWILYNMAVAYQHVGQQQSAFLDFNRVISKYWQSVSEKDYNRNEVQLEFLLNVVPATMQRGSIQLWLQLGYHALQTLADTKVKNWLDHIIKKDGGELFKKAADHLQKRMNLLRLEALLQLEDKDSAEKLLKKFYKDLKLNWKSKTPIFPSPSAETTLAWHTQVVEQAVYWHMEQTRKKFENEIRKIKDDTTEEEKKDCLKQIKVTSKNFTSISKSISSNYWSWVKGNSKDELVYFSRWAQLLKQGTKIVQDLGSLRKAPKIKINHTKKLEEAAEGVLESLMNLYIVHRDLLPRVNSNNQSRYTLEFDRFRSDDLPDFVDGLSVFYKEISKILSSDGREKELICDQFQNHGIDDTPMIALKHDHFGILDALEEHEKHFGENQKIKALDRCNDRIIWARDEKDYNPCQKCLREETEEEAKDQENKHLLKHFGTLLKGCWPAKEVEDYEKENHGIKRPDGNDYELDSNDYERIMQLNEQHLTEHLHRRSLHNYTKNSLNFLGLQRWNSLTPAQGRSVGGGYLIYRTDYRGQVDLGIAIDPGFDFVRNLFNMGFSLMDLNIILISHAHPDHLWDFESIVHLLHELKKKKKITHRLHVIFTLGAYRRLEHVITSPDLRRFLNPLVIDIRKEVSEDFLRECSFRFEYNEENSRWEPVLPDKSDNIKATSTKTENFIEIRPTLAYHDDNSKRSDTFGFIIEFCNVPSPNSNSHNLHFGYSADTKWVSDDLYGRGCPLRYNGSAKESKTCEKILDNDQCWECVASQYANCDVILIHLGSLIDHKSNDDEKQGFDSYKGSKCESLIRSKNHPYLVGTIRFLKKLHKVSSTSGDKLVLIGEFGEELRGGIRADLVKRLKGGVTPSWPVLPVDVGLDILLHQFSRQKGKQQDSRNESFHFLCTMCEQYCPIDKTMELFRYGQDEAIFFICGTCSKATPHDVRDSKLRYLYDVGRELKTLPKAESI